MRRLTGLLVTAAAMSCGPAPAAPPAAPPPAPVLAPASASAAPLPIDPRNTGSLPAGAIARASIDPAKLSILVATLAAAMRPEHVDAAEHALDLPQGSLSGGRFAESLGVEPSRPVVLAVAPLDGHGRALLETVRGKTVNTPRLAIGVHRELEKALNAHRSPPFHIRVVVPASHQPTLIATLHGWLKSRRYVPVAAPSEFASIHARRERVVALSLGPAVVVIDLFAFTGAVPNSKSIVQAASTTLRALKEPAGSEPLALEGDVARLSYAPAQAADLGLVETISRLHDMLGGGSGHELDASISRALREARAFLELRGTPQGAWFEDFELSLRLHDGLPALEAVASYGAAAPLPPGAACAPRPSVDFSAALARFDLTPACIKALPAPREQPGHTTLFDLVMQSSWLEWPPVLPWVVPAATRIPLSWYAGVGPVAMMRFERFGWANPSFGAPDVFWGLMHPGARPQDVACAVAESDPECKGKRRIKTEGFSDLDGFHVRVVKVGDRHVVMSSRDRRALEALSPQLTAAPVAPLRGAVSQGSVSRVLQESGLRSAPVRLVGEARLTGSRLTVSVTPIKN